MIIPTEKDNWSQDAMCNKYGITKLYSKELYTQKAQEDWLNDSQLFEFAADTDHSLVSPFISIILTSSTHSPYNKSYERYSIEYPKDFSPELKHYLNNIHYMDKYLGKYIQSIKKYQWYSKCTIIITADHKPNGPKLNTKYNNQFNKIPVIIINPNITKRVDYKDIEQSSLFPTILDLFCIESKWRGIGQSIFMPDTIKENTHEKERIKNQYNISNYIISNNYTN